MLMNTQSTDVSRTQPRLFATLVERPPFLTKGDLGTTHFYVVMDDFVQILRDFLNNIMCFRIYPTENTFSKSVSSFCN